MTWSAVLASPYNSDTAAVYALGTGLRKRLEGVYAAEWGIDAPVAAPTIAAGALTGVTGDYLACYTYGRKEKNGVLVAESNPSPEPSTAVTLSNGSLLITASEPTDTQVNVIRFYRTAASGTTFYYTGERNYCNTSYACCHDWEEDESYITGTAYRFTYTDDIVGSEDCYSWELVYGSATIVTALNTITSIAENIVYNVKLDDDNLDTELGTSAPSDHDRPPEGEYVFGPTQNGTLFIIDGHRCYYNKPQQPEYWPSTYYVDVSSAYYPLVCGCLYDQRPYLFDTRNAYALVGTQFADLPNMTTYRPYTLESKTGAANAAAVCPVLGIGIFHIGQEGIYRLAPGGDADSALDEKISINIDPIFRGSTLGGIPAVASVTYCWLTYFKDKLYFGYSSGSDTYPKNVIVYDFARQKCSYYVYPFDIRAVRPDRYNERLLAITSTGTLYKIEDSTATTDNGTAIAWEIESKEFVLQTRRHYPRWNKYDVDASNAVSATGYSLLEGSVIHNHTITGNRVIRRRLLPIYNGARFSMRVAGTGPIDIHAIESE